MRNMKRIVWGMMLAMFAVIVPTVIISCVYGGSYNKGIETHFATADTGVSKIGATPGGAQDMSYAIKNIDEGHVPKPEHILTEGLLSEYDLTLEGEKADKLLSINLGVASYLDISEQRNYLVQVGMSSNLDAKTFKRSPLNLCVVVDKSGSMTGEKIAAARRAVNWIIRGLNSDDVLSIVAFNDDADTILSPRRVGDTEDLHEVVDDIEAEHSTDMHTGLKEGFENVLEAVEDGLERKEKSYQRRLILLTDAKPNTGNFATNDFMNLAEIYAEKGIGISAFGIGVDFGIELATSISNLRGSNYRYIADAATLPDIFKDDFDFLVTPLAYDFKMRMSPAAKFRIKQVHGVPGWKQGDPLASIKVATLFASKGGGAIAIELQGIENLSESDMKEEVLKVLDVELGYTEINGKEQSESKSASLSASALKEREYYSHMGVAKTAAIVYATSAMRRACKLSHRYSSLRAAAELDSVPEFVERIAVNTNTPDLRNVAAYVRQLERNINGSAREASAGQPNTPYRRKPDPEPREYE